MISVLHRAACLAAAAAALLPALQARANVVDIVWSAAGEYERNLTIAPGKFAEVCGALKTGQSVRWRFVASHGLDFNIHFHEGSEVRYPARADRVRRSKGTLAVDSAQDYCWMWSNKSANTGKVQVHLQNRPASSSSPAVR